MTKRRGRGKARWLTGPVVAASVWVGAGSGPVSAQTETPPTSNAVVIDTGQRTYRIPYEYLDLRPPQDQIGQVNRWPTFSFAFWMPDGRPVHGLDATSTVLVRPREPGRPPPGLDEYIVKVLLVTAWSAPNARPRPSEQLANSLGIGTGFYDFSEKYGMLAIEPKVGTPENYNAFFGVQRPPQARSWATFLLGCPRDTQRMTQPLCSGDGASRDLEVQYSLVIPYDRIEQALKANSTGLSLLMQWSKP